MITYTCGTVDSQHCMLIRYYSTLNIITKSLCGFYPKPNTVELVLDSDNRITTDYRTCISVINFIAAVVVVNDFAAGSSLRLLLLICLLL